MRLYYFLVFFYLIICVNGRGINGGMSCAVCTVLSGVVMQVAEIREETFLNVTRHICNVLPRRIKGPCLDVLDEIGPHLMNFTEKITPDLFCLLYGTCEIGSDGGFCHLFPLPFQKNQIKKLDTYTAPKIDVCTFPLIDDICKILNNSFISLSALEDVDGDSFSFLETGRGFDWRGRDCDDTDPETYPGRRPLNFDYFTDSNCNGIYGRSNTSYKSWEQVLCEKSDPRSLIYIGDSIGAHFHMPEVWINPSLFTLPVLNASDVILDEIDWPQFGFATGYKNITTNILIKGLTDSIYLRLRNRNRCNHRDYQNLSQNGASSYEGLSHADSIARNQSIDNPALVIYAMQGNDVCNNLNETETHMTPPHIFHHNLMKTLMLLDHKMPAKSHVVLMGLVEADFIYPAMAERLHPIGQLHKNVFYKDEYDWFNCLQIGPCTGWLNSNETLRKLTSKKARQLSRILKKIAKEEKFQNFDVHYVKNPITYLVKRDKINVAEFLEPVDSLHPNQDAQSLMTETLWKFLEGLPETVLGPINPNNEEIEKIFGNQGGH